jgi:hypothetical protein
MADKENTKPTQEQLLKTVSQVLDEALAIYEEAVGENDVKKSAPSGKMDEGIDAPIQMDSMMRVQAKPVSAPGIGDGSTTAIMAKDEDKGKDKDKDKDKDDMEKSDDELMNTYKSLVSKMEKRGLMQKMEKAVAEKSTMKKSEAESEDAVADLRKSIDERFGSMAESIKSVAETVKKIAATPKERKGLTGYQPLKKNEGPAALRKSDVVGKLLDLKKSGDPRVDTLFITRVEQGRLAKGDDDKLKALGILGE